MTSRAESYIEEALGFLRSGDAASAIAALRKALASDPTQADALHLLGIIAFQSGDTDNAINLVQRAVNARPSFSDAYSNLGSMLSAANRNSDAETALRKAVLLKPDAAVYRFNLGNILAAQKNYDEAVTAYQAAVKLQAVYPEAWSNLGIVYRDINNLTDATACFEKAVNQNPNYIEARYNLANAYRDQMKLGKAEEHIRKVIELDPGNSKAHNALGNILSDSARSDEALASFERAEALDPTSIQKSSNILCCLQYLPGITDAALATAHRHWVGRHNDIFTAPRHRITDLNPSRPLNVGFVSADLGYHPCGFLSVSLFENLDRSKIKATVFSNRSAAREDSISKRIATTTEWRCIEALSDAALADAIVDSKIDILVDMNGHTAGHRLAVFGRKPAPIQMTWLGYVGSTGLPTMDHIIADRWHVPEDFVITGPEKILRLDDGYTCYDASVITDDVASLPGLKNGHITFGSLNNANKLSPDVIGSFANIMNGVPKSRIILAFRGLDDTDVTTRLLKLFAGHGIEESRVAIHGYAPHLDFLKHYHQIDIALDTFPYSGGLTTCEALWMGVPVITFSGQTFAGRHATSYLSNAELTDFVAPDRASFERLAISKAHDINALASLRSSLRQRMLASPVMNAARFGASFTNAMRRAWEGYCAIKA